MENAIVEVPVISKKDVRVYLPHYYRHRIDTEVGTVVVFGKITREKAVTVTEEENDNGRNSYEIDVEVLARDGALQEYASYLTKAEFLSSEREYLDAFDRMMQFIEKNKG